MENLCHGKKSLSNHTRTYSQCLLYCLFGSYSIHRSQPHVKESNVLQNERSTQNGMRKKNLLRLLSPVDITAHISRFVSNIYKTEPPTNTSNRAAVPMNVFCLLVLSSNSLLPTVEATGKVFTIHANVITIF